MSKELDYYLNRKKTFEDYNRFVLKFREEVEDSEGKPLLPPDGPVPNPGDPESPGDSGKPGD